VHKLNAEIGGASDRFSVEDDSPLEFYCECGCWQALSSRLRTTTCPEASPFIGPATSGY